MTYNVFSSAVVTWDTVGGISAPNVIRNTLDVIKYFIAQGGALGAVSGAQRITNVTALQAAYSYGVNNRLYMEQTPGIIEINGAVNIPSGEGIIFRGSMGTPVIGGIGSYGSIIHQFATNIPVLTMFDQSGVLVAGRADISGLELDYGVSQTGNTSAITLQLGAQGGCVIKNIRINRNNSGYDAISMTSGYMFDNEYHNFEITGFQNNGIFFNPSIGSSGNLWSNLYITSGGQGAAAAVTGNALNFVGQTENQHFVELDIEWITGNAAPIMNIQGQKGFIVDGAHFEGIMLTGASPYAIDTEGTVANFYSISVTDFDTSTTTGSPCFFRDWQGGGSSTHVDGLAFSSNGDPNTAQLTNPAAMIGFFSAAPLNNDFSNFTIDNFRCKNFGGVTLATQFQTGLYFDGHMPQPTFHFPTAFTRYEYGTHGSKVTRAVLLISSTYTHYGQFEDAVIDVPLSVTSFTLTLAATMGVTGTQKPKTGNTVRIRRQGSGATTGTVTITNGGAGGGNLTSINGTAPLDTFAQFDGTNWVVFTPVS